MGHKINSPSAFSRRRHCPGSARLERGLPDTDSEYSLRGTAAHKVLEACLTENEHVTDYRGHEVVVVRSDKTSTTTVKMNDDDIKAIEAAVSYVHLRQQQGEWEVDCFYEESVTPSLWLNRTDDCDGTLDIGMIHDDWIEIADYKHGAGVPVEAINNDQLLLYAIGFLQKIDWTDKDQNIPVRMTIIQPRAHHNMGPVRTWEIPAHELFAKIPELSGIAAATDDPGAPLFPGDHCRWCKANPCDAVNAQNQAKVQAAFAPVDAPQQPVDLKQAETLMGTQVNLLDPNQLAAVLDLEGFATAWFKEVRAYATERAKAGVKIPGQKLVHANTKRKYGEDGETVIKKLVGLRDTRTEEGKGKFRKADVTKTVPLSITEVEKQVKPYVSERQWKTFSKIIIKPQGAPVLAPETDSRPEIKDATEVFEPIDQPQPVAAAKPPWE